uniref:U11/U12 small nuclear ribonucleoprotein 35 kDa protein n=1 Tax=Clastoptera arizonana TaxID=38151 RepID=A0A1B6D5S4_9HEMI
MEDDDFQSLHQYLSPQAIIYDPLKAGSIDGTDTIPHDKAITRAMEADYKPNTRLQSNPEKTLFVGRLNPNTSEEKVKEVFMSFGNVKSCHLVRDIITGFSKGYAFVEYENERNAALAYKNGNRTVIDGKMILVDFECERLLPGWIPRRLGGGFGGKKDSGQLRFGSRDRPFKKPINVSLK